MAKRNIMNRIIASPKLVITAFALIIMMPELIFGLSYSASYVFNLVWSQQFIDQMGQGDLYPRWLVHSWGGMGHPTFFFYPPLFYWLTGLIGQIGIDVSTAISLASATILAGSGIAMRRWLLTLVNDKMALIGALAYMAEPYHIFDIYVRGALAESAAYLSLPMILLSLARLKAGRIQDVTLLAISYSLLLFAHLPVALLASLTLIPALVLWHALDERRIDWRYLSRALAGGVIGLGLSSIFLLPAIGLFPLVSTEQLATAYFRPEHWFFFTGPSSIWVSSHTEIDVINIGLTLLYSFVALVLAWFNRAQKWALLWGGVALLCFILISGILPFVWKIPLLALVQFPSRLLPIFGIVVITLLILSQVRLPKWFWGISEFLLVVVGALILSIAANRIKMTMIYGQAERQIVLRDYPDAPEYLPKGYPIGLDELGRADPGRVQLPAMPLVEADDPRTIILQLQPRRDGGIDVTVHSSSHSIIEAKRFNFPRWRVEERGRTEPIPVQASARHLASWQVEPGTHHYSLVATTAPYERWGEFISMISLMAVFGMLWLGRRVRNR